MIPHIPGKAGLEETMKNYDMRKQTMDILPLLIKLKKTLPY